MPFFPLTPIGLPPVPEATIISQYANSETMNFLIQNFDTYSDPTNAIQFFYNSVVNLNTAVGYGLDVWGRILGRTRYLNVATGNYVGFTGQGGGSASGFPLGDTEDEAVFYTGEQTTTTFRMGDDQYRIMLFAKAAYNISDCSAYSINKIINILFGPEGLSPIVGQCYVLDNQDMTMQLVLGSQPTSFQLSICQSGIIPVPAGVLLLNPPRF